MRELMQFAITTLIWVVVVIILSDEIAIAETVYVNSKSGLRVRESPDKESEVLEVLPFRSDVEVTKTTDPKWLRTEEGYIRSKYTQDYDPVEDMEFMGEWRITAYAETGFCCANGNYPSIGYTVAHNSLPFGTEIYIEGVGFRTVEDRGPIDLGNAWCDLYMGDAQVCVDWGDQRRRVWRVL